MSAKKYLRMPPPAQAQAAKNEAEERMMAALRKHVQYERQRKKQEQEAEVEEERQRKEREARERRDVMTLGQTREKIQALEATHKELQEKKQELFLTLKKLLNEDENRRKQQQKDANEMYAMHNLMSQQGQFMPPRPQDRPMQVSSSVGPHPPPPQNPGGPGNSMHSRPGSSSSASSVPNNQQPPSINAPTATKRTRSPSPTPQQQQQQQQQQPPNHGHYYKTSGGPGMPPGGQPSPYPQHAPKSIEEGRRVGEVGRAVLWNKPPGQYSANTMFYQVPPHPQQMPPNPSVDPSGRGGHPPNFFPYSTIPSQHLRHHVDMAHMAAAAAAAGQKAPQELGKMPGMEGLDYPPGADRNLVAAYHHQQQQQQQEQRNKGPPPPTQHQQQQMYDVLRWQQEHQGMPPGAPASITRGYMKRD